MLGGATVDQKFSVYLDPLRNSLFKESSYALRERIYIYLRVYIIYGYKEECMTFW